MSVESEEIVERPRADTPLRDGIEEDDHPIPRWFHWTFMASIVFACVYIPYYTLTGWSAQGQYATEVERAHERFAAVRAALPTENPFREDAAAIAEGAQVWQTTCVACHKPDGSGLVGPSVVDPYWKYGAADEDLFETVSAGRPLGMPPWGPLLGSEKIWKVLAYMETLPRSDVPGLGAPDAAGPGS